MATIEERPSGEELKRRREILRHRPQLRIGNFRILFFVAA